MRRDERTVAALEARERERTREAEAEAREPTVRREIVERQTS